MGRLETSPRRWKVVLRKTAERDIKKLRKKYRNIDVDLEAAFSDLETNPTAGSEISGTDPMCRKLRVNSSDIRRGSRSGFRVVYAVDYPVEGEVRILIIRTKAEMQRLVSAEVNKITKMDKQNP